MALYGQQRTYEPTVATKRVGGAKHALTPLSPVRSVYLQLTFVFENNVIILHLHKEKF